LAVGVQIGAVAFGQAGVVLIGPEAVHLVRVVSYGGRIGCGRGRDQVSNGECMDIFLTVTNHPAAAGLTNRPGDILKNDAVGVGFYDSALLDGVAVAGQVPINPDRPGEVQ